MTRTLALALAILLLEVAPFSAAKLRARPPAEGSWCSGGAIALTFDDGPTPQTNRVLDALESSGLRATFFVTGRHVAAYPDIARRIVAEGHEIANHSYSHIKLTLLRTSQIDQEIGGTSDLIYKVTGVRPRFFRPPYGSTNDLVKSRIAAHGLTEALWSLDSRDWKRADEVSILNRLTLLQPGGVVLMHDAVPTTLSVIPSIAWYLREYWRSAPVCDGKLSPTTGMAAIANGPGQFLVRAEPW